MFELATRKAERYLLSMTVPYPKRGLGDVLQRGLPNSLKGQTVFPCDWLRAMIVLGAIASNSRNGLGFGLLEFGLEPVVKEGLYPQFSMGHC